MREEYYLDHRYVTASRPPLGGGFRASPEWQPLQDWGRLARDERIAVIAAGLTPALRANWADPFDGDKVKGYDYNPAKLAAAVESQAVRYPGTPVVPHHGIPVVAERGHQGVLIGRHRSERVPGVVRAG